MTNFELLLSDVRQTPLFATLQKFVDKSRNRFKFNRLRREFSIRTSFTSSELPEFNSIFSIDIFSNEPKKLDEPIDMYLAHKFDILGSGWLDWSYKGKPLGVSSTSYDSKLNILKIEQDGEWLRNIVNEENLNHAQSIWEEILDLKPDYQPIDWSRDMKSGYRYRSHLFFKDLIVVSPKPVVDVKVPWELSRMQHLPMMLKNAVLIEDKRSVLATEIKCQMLDFIATNPPYFGVNWTSAMEASMRMMNMVIACDGLLQLDPTFKSTKAYSYIVNSIMDHIYFAWEEKEHKNGLGNNHYLANLCGLIYSCHAFKGEQRFKELLDELMPIILDQIDRQFLTDGGNFESSSTYHYFGTEISILGLAVIRRMIKESDFYHMVFTKIKTIEEKLLRSQEMMESFILPDGSVVQVGDNDSARMFYFDYQFSIITNEEAAKKYHQLKDFFVLAGDGNFYDRNQLDYKASIDITGGYFNSTDSKDTLHGKFIKSIIENQHPEVLEAGAELNLSHQPSSKEKFEFNETTLYKSESKPEKSLLDGLEFHAYPKFGVYVFRSKALYLLINATNRHVKQYWPHSHNDKLSFELWLEGKPIIRDSGSYCYTSETSLRNKYRSVNAHATVVFGEEEQNTWLPGDAGVFRMLPETKVSLISHSETGISFECVYRGFKHIREWKISANEVTVIDTANKAFKVIKHPEISFSNGYGKMLN